MKKIMSILLAACLVLALAACGAAPAAPENGEWTREGYYSDESGNMLSVTWMEDVIEPGWYVGLMTEDIMAGWTIPQEGSALHGNLNGGDESAEPLVVTVSEEGADGLQLSIEGGGTYHFKPMEMPEASIFVSINTEGIGAIAYAEGESTPEIDREHPYQSAQINLGEPAAYTFLAWPPAGSAFVKWTRNGEDLSTEPEITVLLDESADYVAVFEEDPGWQNPVMNFVGEYQCDRAQATVECFGSEDAWITIRWGGSAWETAQWDIVGRLDPDTLIIAYSGCTKSILTYDENGELTSQEPEYEDGSGTITFHDDGTFTWHEDQSESGTDMLFQWVSAPVGMANPWREISEGEAREVYKTGLAVPENAKNVVWNVMEDPAGFAEPLVQLFFELDGNSFTAREQVTGDPEADISGMYYEWTDQREVTLKNWPNAVCRSCRWIGEQDCADLCAWYDAASGTSYTLSVMAEDLDGFDLQAIAEALHG